MSLRVLIVADGPIARSRVRDLLSPHDEVHVVAEAEHGRQAIFEARAQRPDVIVLDGVPPPVGESVRRVLAEVPQGKALVLTDRDDLASVREAFGAGATGYLLEGADGAEVFAAVRALAAGQSYVDPALGARVIAAELRQQARTDGDRLTSRQREVLRLLALGHTNQEVAETLVLSVRTVETHRAHLMQKLRFSSRAELVRYALEHGLLDTP